MNLPRFALTHRTFTLALVFLTLALGVQTFLGMPRREDPEITIRTHKVTVQWPGATSENVENLVTDPIEEALAGIAEVKEITSESRVGVSLLTIEYEDWANDIDQLADEVRAKLSEVTPRLPRGCQDPVVNADFGDVASVVLALYGVSTDAPAASYTYRQLEVLAEHVRDELKRIESVADVSILGAQEEVIYLEVDGADWSQVELTSKDLQQLLESRNIVAPGGTLDAPEGTYFLSPSGQFQDVAELGEVLVGHTRSGAPIRLSDLDSVRVRRTYVDPPTARVRFQSREHTSRPALLLAVEMKDGRNVVEMGRAVVRQIDQLEATTLPPDVELALVNDLPRQVNRAVASFTENLWQSVAIVLMVAWLLMGLRPAIVMALAIPASMLSAIALMPAFHVQLEQFSIASLIIALGMVVDNAIVVSDNSVHELGRGRDRLAALIKAAHSLAIPILTSTLTTVVVFAPMALMPGSSGEYVRSLPIVVALTLLLSYLVGMCLTPILCFYLLKPGTPRKAPLIRVASLAVAPLRWTVKKLFRRRDEGSTPSMYVRFLRACIARPITTMAIAILLFVASLQLIPVIGTQFFPPGYRDQFFVKVWLPDGTPTRQTERVCRAVEDAVRRTRFDSQGVDRMVNCISHIGFGGPRLMLTMSPESRYSHYAFLIVNTTGPEASNAWVRDLRRETAVIPGARILVQPASLGPPLDTPVEFRFHGDDANVLRDIGREALTLVRNTPGITDVSSDWGNETNQVQITIDEDAANLAGVSNEDIASTLAGLLDGRVLTTYSEGEHSIDIVVRVQASGRSHVADLNSIYVSGKNGKVPLSSLAEIKTARQPSVIRREDQVRTIGIGARVGPDVLANVMTQELEPKMSALLASRPGYRMSIGGEMEETSKGQQSQGRAFLLGLLGIVLVLVAQYNSILKPLVILVTLPLALIGSLIGLLITGWPLGFMATLGVISLFGVVLNNAIVLIDFIQSRVRDDVPLRDAVVQAGERRMQPILLTTLTTIGGLFPLGLFGGPLFAPMAWAMVFGLIFATVLTLVVIPTVYTFFSERLRMNP